MVSQQSVESSSDLMVPADETPIYERAKEERENTAQSISFGFKEFCTFLGVSQSFIIRKEKEIPELAPKLVQKGKRELREYTPYDAVKARNLLQLPKPNLEHNIFVFNNMKGGTGKSLQSFSFAAYCACAGLRVLAADGCGQGHLSYHLGVIPERNMFTLAHLAAEEAEFKDCIQKTKYPSVDLIPGTVMLNHLNEYFLTKYVEWGNTKEEDRAPYPPIYFFAELFQKVKNDYDVIIVDTAPSFDLRTQALILAAENLIIPVQLAYEATLGMADFFYLLNWLKKEYPSDLFKLTKNRIKILSTFSTNYNMSKHVLGFLAENYKDHLLQSTIRQSEINKQATSHTCPPFIFDKKSDASADHVRAVRELLNITPLEQHAWI